MAGPSFSVQPCALHQAIQQSVGKQEFCDRSGASSGSNHLLVVHDPENFSDPALDKRDLRELSCKYGYQTGLGHPKESNTGEE